MGRLRSVPALLSRVLTDSQYIIYTLHNRRRKAYVYRSQRTIDKDTFPHLSATKYGH